jgi:hypothetical protein
MKLVRLAVSVSVITHEKIMFCQIFPRMHEETFFLVLMSNNAFDAVMYVNIPKADYAF